MQQRGFRGSDREVGGSSAGAGTGSRFVAGALSAWVAFAGTAVAGSAGLLHIGGNKQLFIDDYVIESLSHAKQILNPAVKHPANPLLKQDRPWEGHYVGLQKLIYDPDRGIYRIWYRTTGAFESQKGGPDRLRPYRWDWSLEDGQAVRSKAEEVYGYKQYADGKDWLLCYATSSDGIHWEKPNLGQVEFEGSRDNNILPPGTLVPLFRDEHETDPAKRYKSMRSEGTTPTVWKPGMKPGMRQSLYYSPDGFEWTPYENNPVIDTAPKIGRWGPTSHMGWDPIRQVYAVFMEQCLHRGCPRGQRIIGRAESPDMTRWTPDQNVLIQDELDYPDTEFYSMPVMTYEGIYIGLPWIFRTTNTLHYPQLAFSRDGVRFERRFRQPFLQVGDKGDFDESTIYVHQPMVRDGEIRIYYYGGNWRGSEALHEQGGRAMFAVALATVREDGFVSVDAGKIHPGVLTTRILSFEGRRLVVNLEAAKHNHGSGRPEVRVEIIGNDHHPIPGHTLDESDPARVTGKHVMSWRGQTELGALAGTPVQLRFVIRNAKLFSFQFRP